LSIVEKPREDFVQNIFRLFILIVTVIGMLSACNSGADQSVIQPSVTLQSFPVSGIYDGDIQSSDGMGAGKIYGVFDLNGEGAFYFNLNNSSSASIAASSGVLNIGSTECYSAPSRLTNGEHGKFILRNCNYQNDMLIADYTTMGNDSGTDSGKVSLSLERNCPLKFGNEIKEFESADYFGSMNLCSGTFSSISSGKISVDGVMDLSMNTPNGEVSITGNLQGVDKNMTASETFLSGSYIGKTLPVEIISVTQSANLQLNINFIDVLGNHAVVALNRQ
jgi:hypothetical protein